MGFCGRDSDWDDPVRSPRGMILAMPSKPTVWPVLTVEIYEKWYSLFLVHEDGRVEIVHFTELEPYVDHTRTSTSAYCDHVPNPIVVEAFADAKGLHLYSVALELITGRWTLDIEP